MKSTRLVEHEYFGSPFRVPNEVAARVNSFWFRKLSTEKPCYIVPPKDAGNESFL